MSTGDFKSIEKLRELCAKWRKTSITPGRNSAADEVDAIVDEIEQEIAERYIELLVDVDGVSIPIDDFNAACDHYGFVKERTCRNISGVPLKFKCSKCGDILSKPSIDEWNYCPNCGARVIGWDE